MTEQEKVLAEHKDERNETEIWSRVMGYYRPRSQYNKGKTQESIDRKCFDANIVVEDKVVKTAAE